MLQVSWPTCVLCVLVGCATAPRTSPQGPVAATQRPGLVAPAQGPVLAAAPVHDVEVAVATPPDVYLRCDDPGGCIDGVGVAVFPGEPLPERCTATLIAPDQILTASHCLAPGARTAGASCDGAWMAFPSRDPAHAAAAEWIPCRRVLEVKLAPDASALNQELARLELAWSSTHAPLAIDASALTPGSIVRVVSVTPHPVYPRTLSLQSRLCRSIDSEPAVDALGSDASRVGWLSSCPIHAGNSGSPVLDRDGRIRAIVHGGTWTGFAMGVTSAPSVQP